MADLDSTELIYDWNTVNGTILTSTLLHDGQLSLLRRWPTMHWSQKKCGPHVNENGNAAIILHNVQMN